jgi:hypothetical protein
MIVMLFRVKKFKSELFVCSCVLLLSSSFSAPVESISSYDRMSKVSDDLDAHFVSRRSFESFLMMVFGNTSVAATHFKKLLQTSTRAEGMQ